MWREVSAPPESLTCSPAWSACAGRRCSCVRTTARSSLAIGFLLWLSEANIDTALIDPGKPWQNGDNESFNGKFRDKCLSMEWFRSRKEAAVLIEVWRRHYNHVRPHSSLSYRTPTEFRRHYEATHQGAML